MFIPDELMYRILLWLPVISLLRFKFVCRSWCVLIESSDFIKSHLHLHHYDPRLKDKDHNLIYRFLSNDPPIAFPLISIDSFEAPNVCLQLDRLELHGYFPIEVHDIVSFNGILCLNLFFKCNKKQSICLWNPATKQSRFLPQSPFPLIIESKYDAPIKTVGFGFDVKTNDYKVVNLMRRYLPDEKRVEVYNLSKDVWKSITPVFPVDTCCWHPRMPFNNGACFCWKGMTCDFGFNGIICFDFSSEMFRTLSYPSAGCHLYHEHLSIISDKIACVFNVDLHCSHTEIWIFNEYGTVNESWTKLYRVDPYSTLDITTQLVWLSMDGKYLFFREWEQICIYNVVTKEFKNVSDLGKYREIVKDCGPPNTFPYLYFFNAVVEFKESLVSVGGGNDAAPICVNKKSKKKKKNRWKKEGKNTSEPNVVTELL